MHSLAYWFLKKIASSPRAFAWGSGAVTIIVLLLASAVATIWIDRNQVSQRHKDAIEIFRVSTTESVELLEHLHQHDALDCTADALMHLNTHLLMSRYIREIGVLDEERRLLCTTSLGLLPQPYKGGHRVYQTRAGFELLNNVPLAMADTEFLAVIIQLPPFNVVLSRYATGDIFASADVVWLHTTDGLISLNVSESNIASARRERAAQPANVGFRLHGMSYELITSPEGQDLVLQTERSFLTVFQENASLFTFLLGASILVGTLVTGALAPQLRQLADLRHRIAYLCNDENIKLVYQPIFDLGTLRPVGCEVLARLKEGSKLWEPEHIIPAIQAAGLHAQFDKVVAAKAIRELGLALPPWDEMFIVALNCFPESIDPDTLIPELSRALQTASRNDLQVCIEITEHSLSSDLISEVQQLREQGFWIAVDDFGIGYSNLKAVTALSPDLLKIDRSFIHDLEDEGLRSNLIPDMVNIASVIDARLVAEGIEQVGQVQLLKAAGVPYGQGYALARPMPLSEFLAFLLQHRPGLC